MRSGLRRGLWLLGCIGCTPLGDPAVGASGFRDDFERTEFGDLWFSTGGPYRISNGQVRVAGARNKPLWLRRTLPRDGRIDLDVRSESPEGDIKVEVFGDGESKATGDSYVASGYVVILGGWSNSKNVIARMNEHGDDRVVGPNWRVVPSRTYHLTIKRKGSVLTVFVDNEELMHLDDDDPLEGRGHDHFGFNNWQAELWFDNLRIQPL